MSSIWDFFGRLFGEIGHPPTSIAVKASNYINSHLTADQIADLVGKPVTAGHQYIRIWASRMMLHDSVEWFTSLYPAVYSIVHLHFGDNDVDLANLAGPKQLGNLKSTDANHLLQINTPMTGLLPFRGGTVQLSCGLAQMPISNLLANFLNTVGDFAGKLAQPQVSAGIALAQSVVSGVQSLLGVSDAKLQLYYDSTFTGVAGEQTLRSGFFYLSDQPAGTITADQLWIIDGEPRIGASSTGAKLIDDQNYMLVQIELLTERDDWDQFKTIETPLQNAIKAKIAGKDQDAAGYLVTARLAAFDSDDLTDFDRARVIKAINDAYNDVGTALQAEGTSSPTGGSLKALMKSATPAHEALPLSLPTRASLLAV